MAHHTHPEHRRPPEREVIVTEGRGRGVGAVVATVVGVVVVLLLAWVLFGGALGGGGDAGGGGEFDVNIEEPAGGGG
ncbi:MAG TPA: hypothetical protein VHF25_11010 [Nitriliruptorales bacterium]|nr:hypothetical protein [Nitriliruptorales bacterium]